jgi:hypothetical protein
VSDHDKIAAVCNLLLFLMLRGSGSLEAKVTRNVTGVWNPQVLDRIEADYLDPLAKGCVAAIGQCEAELAAAAADDLLPQPKPDGEHGLGADGHVVDAAEPTATTAGGLLQVEMNLESSPKSSASTVSAVQCTMMKVEILQDTLSRINQVLTSGRESFS